MYYYLLQNSLAASFLPDLPFPAAEEGIPALFLLNRDPKQGPAVFRPTHANQLCAETVDISLLDPMRMPTAPELAAPELAEPPPQATRDRVMAAAMTSARIFFMIASSCKCFGFRFIFY